MYPIIDINTPDYEFCHHLIPSALKSICHYYSDEHYMSPEYKFYNPSFEPVCSHPTLTSDNSTKRSCPYTSSSDPSFPACAFYKMRPTVMKNSIFNNGLSSPVNYRLIRLSYTSGLHWNMVLDMTNLSVINVFTSSYSHDDFETHYTSILTDIHGEENLSNFLKEEELSFNQETGKKRSLLLTLLGRTDV